MKGTFFKHFKNLTAVCGAALVVMLASCSNFIETENVRITGTKPEQGEKTGKTVTVHITADEEAKLPVRTAFPTLSVRDELVSFTLKEGGEVIKSWIPDTVNNIIAYRVMQQNPASLTEGTHTLTLMAKDAAGTVYAGTLKDVEVTEGAVLNFTLYFADVTENGQKGNVIIRCSRPSYNSGFYDGNYVNLVAGLYHTDDMVTLGSLYNSKTSKDSTTTSRDFSFENVPAGYYIAKVDVYGGGYSYNSTYVDVYTALVGSITEPVYVTGGSKTSTAAINFGALQSTYSITYYFNGGAKAGLTMTSIVDYYSMMQNVVLYGSEYDGVTSSISVTKNGFDFAGWYADPAFSYDPVSGWSKKTTANNISLYAKWNYNVTYDANGSDEAPVTGYVFSQAAQEGTSVKLNKNTFNRPGYLFNGWNTVASPTEENPGTIYEDCSTAVFSGHTTLYAQWKERAADKVAVTFRANGGTLVDIQEVTAGSTLTEPSTTYAHYSFDGWYTTENFEGEAVDFATFAPEHDVTLYAKWNPDVYTIIYKDRFENALGTYDFTGVQADEYPQTHTYGFKTKLKTPHKDGCEFIGWYVADVGYVTELGAFDYTADVTVSAEWQRNTYHVSSSGSDTGADGSVEYPYATVTKAVTSIKNTNAKLDYKIVIHGEVTENVSLTTDNLPQDNAKSLTLRGASNNTVDKLNGNAAGRVLNLSTKVPLIIEDLAITNGKGGIFMSSDYSSVTLGAGALITENNASSDNGGAVYLKYGYLYINEGAEISYNTAAYSGGAIYTWGGTSRLYINGGIIKNNKSVNSNKPGIYIEGTSGVYINGGTITGHNGIAVYVERGYNVNMNGGTISNNGRAIYFNRYSSTVGKLIMKGDAYIPYGGANGKNDVYFGGDDGAVSVTGTLTGGSEDAPVVAVTPYSYAYGKQVVSAADGIDIVSEASKIALVPNGEPWIIGQDGKITGETYNIVYRDMGNKNFTGENVSELPAIHTYGVATTLVTPVREGYDFVGWFTESSGTGTSYTTITAKQFKSDFTLYARWAEKSVAVEITNGDITLTKTQNNGVITLTASAGFTDYLWTVGNASATSAITGSTVSADGKTFTFNTANLAAGKSYAITVSALDSNGIEYTATAQVKK